MRRIQPHIKQLCERVNDSVVSDTAVFFGWVTGFDFGVVQFVIQLEQLDLVASAG